MNEIIIKHYPDIWFSLIIEKTVGNAHFDFKIHKIVSIEDGPKEKLLYKKIGDPNETENIDESEIFIQGWAKFSGCIAYQYNDSLHICSIDEIDNIREIFKIIYEYIDQFNSNS